MTWEGPVAQTVGLGKGHEYTLPVQPATNRVRAVSTELH